MDLAITVMGLIGWLIIGCFVVARLVSFVARQKKLSMEDRWVVVTGCDSGIGQGVMGQLIEDQASVIAFCLTEEGAKAALEAGAKLAPQLDITDSAAVREACDQVIQACGGQLWGVAHIAGYAQPGFIEFQHLDNYHRTMDVNFFAITEITQRLIPCLKPTRGRVAIVSSVDGIVSLPGNAPYDAAKFAVDAYADALRIELSFWEVSVSVINPSTLRTPMMMKFFESETITWEKMEQLNPDGIWKQGWTREWLDEYIEQNVKGLDIIAQDPKHAVNDICHALAGARPKHRYLSGTLAKTLFYALWIMPEGWSYRIKKAMISPTPNTELPGQD
ncbi:MAG: SDR family NAD(P)-dependent oxidoreductase [Halieaceae bacterium]|nr:SDR family NAD(P)-dependent oxidoreductase [Halieaceae bacterium]